jgi:hypothetical protein
MMRKPLVVFVLLGAAACLSRPIEDGDRRRVLTIEQLRPYGVELPEDFAKYERLERTKWLDGSTEVEYEFDAIDELGLPYLFSSAERHPSKSDACMSFSAGNLGLKIGGVELTERNDLFSFGDKSRFGILVNEGEPVGNYFAMCHGKTAFMVIVGGVYFDDTESWTELVQPTLDALVAEPPASPAAAP